MLRFAFTAALGLVFLGFGTAEDKKEVPKELKPLQGKWKMTKMNGVELKLLFRDPLDKLPPDAVLFPLVITGNKIEIDELGPKPKIVGTIKVDNTKKPAHFDITDSRTEYTDIGIYKIEKDTLTICTYPGTGGEMNRPTEFGPHEDKTISYEIYVYEKVK